MAPPAPKNPLKHLRATDLRAMTQLAAHATKGVVHMVEGVHQSVRGTLGAGQKDAGQTTGIAKLVYQSVRGAAHLLGKGLETVLTKLEPYLQSTSAQPSTPEREAVLAALNGVLGDQLAASHNPLATPMTLRYQGAALDWHAMPAASEVTGKILVVIHGLCMNDLQWHTQHSGITVEHAQTLADTLGYTPVYVRYNTGLHTSQNGHALSEQLDLLVAHWPTAVTELTLLVHSMGGLVSRSTVYYAQQDKSAWLNTLKNIVFLGTPHHGAPLEKAGNWVDIILGSTPYSKPFAKLGQLRSSGITDLRYGHVLDEDWQGHDRFRRQPDSRQSVPLPQGIACYTVAATIAAKRSALAERLVGDGLVPLPSALGQHAQAARSLIFAKASQHICYRTNHMQLLSSPEVTEKLVHWLSR